MNNIIRMSEPAARPERDQAAPAGGRDLRAEVRAVLAEGLTQSKAARQCGMSGARLGQWLADKYKGDNAAAEAEISAWLDGRDARADVVRNIPDVAPFIETPTAMRIIHVLRYTHSGRDLGLVAGAAGVGKTTAVNQYVNVTPNAWRATMSPATAGLVPALEEVAAALTLESRGGAASTFRAVVTRVRDTGGVVVVDEAQHLCPAALDQLRAIGDAASIGIVFVGNQTTMERVTTQDATYAQIASRLGRRVNIKLTSQGDLRALLAAWGVTSEEVTRAACQIVQRDSGSLRDVVKCLRLAFADSENGNVSAKAVTDAWRARRQAVSSPR